MLRLICLKPLKDNRFPLPLFDKFITKPNIALFWEVQRTEEETLFAKISVDVGDDTDDRALLEDAAHNSLMLRPVN